MANENSVSDIFRFVQLRPRRALDETPTILLAADTSLARGLAAALTVSERAALANASLKALGIRAPADTPLGPEIVRALNDLAPKPEATTVDLWTALPGLSPLRDGSDFKDRSDALSDVLLASYFGTRDIPAELDALQQVYRVYHLPAAGGESVSLDLFLRRPLLVAPFPRQRTGTPPARSGAAPSVDTRRAALDAAIGELAALDRRELLEQPDENGLSRRGTTPFALSAAGRGALSPKTMAMLSARNIDVQSTPFDMMLHTLMAEKLAIPWKGVEWTKPPITTQAGVTLPPAPATALVGPAGVADLLVVKQQIKRYEAAEIAHVENVLIGEKKSRAHRQLERSEETFLTETETTRTQETELETADRFELNREASETIKNDQKIGFGLTLSGKYGPTVEFSSAFSVDSSTSHEQSAKSSSRFAKDIVNRSLERLTSRVREVRSRTIIRETEETNLHELNNETGKHVVGIYQFIDKVYETQVFNYGIREMFDFMIPEPASFLWYVEQHPTLDVDLPPEPMDLASICPNASYVTEDLARALAATYGAEIDPPPSPYVVITAALKHGEDDTSESGHPRSNQQIDVTVPPGYRPYRATIQGLAVTDDNPVVAVTIATARALWQPAATDRVDVSGGYQIAYAPKLYLTFDPSGFALSSESKLSVLMIAYETKMYSFDVAVVAARTAEWMDTWRLATFRKLQKAHEDRRREYEQLVKELRAEAEARAERENRMPFGAPPSMNRQTIATELKKHCISVLTQQWYDAFDATKDGTPPTFDFAEAIAEGAYIRFFEQAFEWDQVQWVFYPYFWARKATWIDRFVKQDVDPQFLEFLRAGSARVVVPVRPGFELAVTHFLETGKLWGGEGEPPQINSPLYVSIIDEIRERTGAPQGEIAVGEPWEARVPTALVKVREGSDLPKWTRTSTTTWDWKPDETN